MRTIFSLVLILCMLPVTAFAQTPPIVTMPPGDDRIVGLKSGQSAPFDGQLFDTNTAIRWGNWMQQYQLRIKIDVDTQQKVDMAQINYLNEIIKLERQKYTTVTTDYQARVKQLELQLSAPTPWYKTQTFAFVMGAVCVTGVFSLSVWALEARK